MKKKLTEGTKHDSGKLPHHLVSKDAIEGLVEILQFGAVKYDSWNWAKGLTYSRVYDALTRHLIAWFSGEDLDPETGKNHCYHVLCNAMFLAHFVSNPEKYKEFDDRPIDIYKKEEENG